MKELLKKMVSIGTEGSPPIKGELVGDYPDRFVVASSNEDKTTFVTTIYKNKITYFMIKEETPIEKIREIGNSASALPLTILSCENKKINCPGVRFIANKHENKIEENDFEGFMSLCPVRKESCKCGIIGNILNAKPEYLVNILSGIVIGEYPEEKENKSKKSTETKE